MKVERLEGEHLSQESRPDAGSGTPFGERVDALQRLRAEANEAYFAREAERLARCCHRMAERFARGGRLLAVATTPAAWSDARHVAVEFVHPVIVGKRALPALALGPGALSAEVEPADIVIAFGPGVQDAVGAARATGALTLAFAPGSGAEWELDPSEASDEHVRQELAETAYHVLWELIHVFLDHAGLLEGRNARPVHDSGAASFLYPFLGEQEHDLEAVVDDVRASVLMKAAEVTALRAQTLGEFSETLRAAAAAVRERLAAGGRVLALGNGGSATDAMDVVADLRAAGRRALDLTDDTGVITAVANDIGTEAIFSRQVIAYGRPGDVVLALSTSGTSPSVLHALAEARRRGLLTIALVGYEGGSVAADGLADHVVVSRSEHIPRIQEAQASAYHVLCALLEVEETA